MLRGIALQDTSSKGKKTSLILRCNEAASKDEGRLVFLEQPVDLALGIEADHFG